MSNGPDLDHLAAQWAEHPDGLAFAALGEGLRKRGALSEALSVLMAGVARRPAHIPGHIALSRVHAEGGRFQESEQALREALRHDPAHPGVLDALAAAADARGDGAAARAWREALAASLPEGDAEGEDGADPVAIEHLGETDEAEEMMLSESLAALYHRQGHLERAHQLYLALAARDPSNAGLASTRDAILAELTARRPLPYDARTSGGMALRDVLGAIAAGAPAADAPAAGYDAFFEPDAPPPDESADLEAFQSWLKGLTR